MTKQNIYIIGNCVSKSIVETLKGLKAVNKKYRILTSSLYIYGYKKGTLEANEVLESISKCDILIHMSIKSKNFIGIDSDEMRTIVHNNGGLAISIPTPFFQGYWPESSFYRFLDSKNKVSGELCCFPGEKNYNIHYFDTVVLYNTLLGREVNGDSDPFYKDEYFNKPFLENIARSSIKNLSKREHDDKIDSFRNFKKT